MSDAATVDDRARRLLRAGVLLFLLALVTGLALPLLHNPRMALAAHVGGVTNALFLLVLGLAWPRVVLGERLRGAVYRAALFGTFGNWAAVTAAAIWGTKSLTPIAGAGFGAERWRETLVAAALVAVGVAMLAVAAALLAGLRKPR